MGMGENEPLAKTRTRRSNAGARMHEMIFNAEADPQYAQAFGDLLKTDDDSSDDEEYVPKELDSRDNNQHGSASNDGDEGEDDDSPDSDGSSSDSDSDSDSGESGDDSGSDQDQRLDEDEYDEEGDTFYDGDAKLNKSKKITHKIKKEIIISSSSPAKNVQLFNIKPGSPSLAAYKACKEICCVCLGDKSGEDDEIIDCDSCGISVHESCYGVANDNFAEFDDDDETVGDSNHNNDETSSVNSNRSSESTEPWFCEPCRRSVKQPVCELCPNLGGIFKETDAGRWVHMVCALYTRGVTFENVDRLSDVSLFELNHALYGSKACIICEDRRLARTGICIGCDAGLCKTFFHATCAQKEGLLFESHSDEVDPYFAQCKQHADKDIIKKKKKLFTVLQARLKKIRSFQENNLNTNSQRIASKLFELTKESDPHLTRWSTANPPPIPKKVSRMLLTSPSLIIKLNKKSELMGIDTKSAASDVNDEFEAARQKWHILPAFDLEFVAYCLDRTTRMVNMKKQQKELVEQNIALKTQESKLRDKYNAMNETAGQLRSECAALINEARNIQRAMTNATGKSFNLPMQMELLISQSPLKKKATSTTTPSSAPNGSNQINANSTFSCGKCGTIKDQHLLTLCDTCNSHIHIYCLDPPLTRVPKKTKFGGWQCSDCTERDDDDEEEKEAREREPQQQSETNDDSSVGGRSRRLRAPKVNALAKRFKSEYWN